MARGGAVARRSAAASGVDRAGRVSAWQRSAGKLAVESTNKLEYDADGTVKKKTFDLFQLTDLASGAAPCGDVLALRARSRHTRASRHVHVGVR